MKILRFTYDYAVFKSKSSIQRLMMFFFKPRAPSNEFAASARADWSLRTRDIQFPPSSRSLRLSRHLYSKGATSFCPRRYRDVLRYPRLKCKTSVFKRREEKKARQGQNPFNDRLVRNDTRLLLSAEETSG